MRFAFLAFALSACPPEPVHPVTTVDSAPTCVDVAAHIGALGCVDAKNRPYTAPNDLGESFDVTCSKAVQAGAHVPLDCLLSAADCAAVKACK